MSYDEPTQSIQTAGRWGRKYKTFLGGLTRIWLGPRSLPRLGGVNKAIARLAFDNRRRAAV